MNHKTSYRNPQVHLGVTDTCFPAFHRKGSGSIRGQSMWDLWWTEWHWDRVFSKYFFLGKARYPGIIISRRFRRLYFCFLQGNPIQGYVWHRFISKEPTLIVIGRILRRAIVIVCEYRSWILAATSLMATARIVELLTQTDRIGSSRASTAIW